MIRLLVFLSLLAGHEVAATTSYSTSEFKERLPFSFSYYGQPKSHVYVGLNTSFTAICFDEYFSTNPNQDCIILKAPVTVGSSISRYQISTSAKKVFKSYIPTLDSGKMMSHFVAIQLKIRGKNYYVNLIPAGYSGGVLLNPYYRQEAESEFFVGGRIQASSKGTNRAGIDVSSCRSSDNDVLLAGQTKAANCTVETCKSVGPISVLDCDKHETCHGNRCIYDAICTFVGPSVIDANGTTGNIIDLCDYKLLTTSKSDFIEVKGKYGDHRRTDVSFLDTVVIKLGSAEYYLEQGGRVKAGNQILNLTTPKLFDSLEISKDEKGVTALYNNLNYNLNVTVFFDGYTAQIHLHGADQTNFALQHQCEDASHSSRINSDSCQNVQADKADPSIDCLKAKERCGVLRKDPFTSCHAHIAPDNYVKVCEETLCSYPSVDNLPCHYLEAYARACSLKGGPELSGWREISNCPTTHKALCQDKFCASHEFCGETVAPDGWGCLCRAAFASPYRQKNTFGNATTCSGSSASVSIINCLLTEKGFDYTTLHLNDAKCKGELQEGLVTFSFNNTEICKAEVTESDTQVIYTNTIQMSESNASIIREDEVALNFSCSYAQPAIKTMSFKILGSSVVSEIQSGTWKYNLTMKAYSDAGLIQAATSVRLNQKIWVELKTAGLDSNLVAVVIDSCWANKNKESNRLPKYDLIKKGCANPKDKSVKVEGNGEGTSSVWSFNMFQFTKSNGDVFLHCKVNLCSKKDKSCAPVCKSKHRRSARNMYLDGAPALISMAWTS